MKYAIRPNTTLQQIPVHATEIHLVRPISFRQLQTICTKRAITLVTASESSHKRLRKKIREWLKQKKISLQLEHHPGRPLDVSPAKIQHVAELVKDHRSYREIESTTQIPKSTAHYLVKYAQRDKIRQNGATVLLI